MEGTSDPGELLSLIKSRTVSVERAREMNPADLKGKIIIGRIFQTKEKREFSKALYEIISSNANRTQNID